MTAPDPIRTPTSPAQSIDDLDVAIRRLASGINAQSYRFLVLVREFDDRFGWMKWSCRSCAEWLAWRCDLSVSAAREHVRTAHALRGLPAISAAFAEGKLSYSKVRALTRAAHLHDEDLLLAYALQSTAAQVEERCRQIRNVAPESAEEAQRAWQRRSLSIWRNAANGTLRITVELPIEEGEIVARAIEHAVETGDVPTGPEPGEQSWYAQQADGLVAVAKDYLHGGASGSSSTADHCQVVLHVEEQALRGGAGRSDLPIDTIKRLTCDGSVLTVVEGADGTPLDVGRKQRTVSTVLKRALWSRDRGCTFPGCGNKRYIDAHHVRHWADGGETSADNLTLLCSYHHRLLHEGGYRIAIGADGERYFQRPDGRAIPRGGYALDDVLDDGVDVAALCEDENPSAEAWLAAVVNGRNAATDARVAAT
jgi:uncharacterized protein DUF222/HNH endonuclease